eukprot:EC716202.1.p2 GENE.EC716202.1~~EC716202.1.p2  ORF type:complete len:93 (+),score=21.46 EC716202.1:159-437(+)
MYVQNKSHADTSVIMKLIDQAVQTASFMRASIVQGRLNERGAYELDVQPHHLNSDKHPQVMSGGCGNCDCAPRDRCATPKEKNSRPTKSCCG